MKRITLLLIFIGALAAVGYFFLLPGRAAGRSAPGGEDEPTMTATVRRASMPVVITAGGELASADAVDVLCELEGQGHKIIEMLPEGSQVSVGEVVIRLDQATITDRLAAQQIKVTQAEGLAKQAAEELKIQQNLAASQIAQAELAELLAELDREKYVKGEYKIELNDLQGSIALAQADLQDARAEVEHFVELVRKGFATPEQLRSKEQAEKRAEHNLSRDEQRLKVLETYTRRRQVVELEAKALEVQRELERAKGSAAAAIAKAETDLEVALATAKLERRQLDRIEQQLQLCEVTAPAEGTVVYAKEKNKSIERGADVHYKQKLFSLPSSRQMQVNAFVHESVVKQVQPGMATEVRIDAFANLVLKGSVQEVASFYNSTKHWLSGGVKEYATVISIDGLPDVAIRSGLTAEVRIFVAHLSDSLVVPLSAVTQQDGRHYCFVVGSGGTVLRPVSVGSITEEFVEITDGLNEGEQVALDARRRARTEIQPSQSTQVAGNDAGSGNASAAP